jgi:microcompartment protein CcmK/EutM
MLKLQTSNLDTFYVFDSATEVKNFVQPHNVKKQIRRGMDVFVGRSFEDTDEFNKALDEAWKRGIDTMNQFVDQLEKAELPKIKDLKRTKVFSSSEGELDHDRMLAGNPNCFVKFVTEKGEGNPEVTVVIDTCGAGFIDPDDLLWRGAGAIALVKMLEQQGYRTEIWALSGATCFHDYPQRGIIPTVCLKRPGEPLDISTLINTVSGWFFRVEIFGLYYQLGENEKEMIKDGLGQHFVPTEVDLDLLTSDQKRIFCANVFSFDGTLELLLQELQRIADRDE